MVMIMRSTWISKHFIEYPNLGNVGTSEHDIRVKYFVFHGNYGIWN